MCFFFKDSYQSFPGPALKYKNVAMKTAFIILRIDIKLK